MTLGIFLAMGDSFENMTKSGQDELFKKFYLKTFAKEFEKVYVFSYANEQVKGLPKNVKVISNKLRLHRYLYGFTLPILNFSKIKNCDIFRVYHLFGTPPAIISKLFFKKPFIFNFAYDYQRFATIDNKSMQVLFFKILRPFATLFATKIFAATRMIQKSLPADKTIYLPNGVDTDFFKPASKKTNARPVVLSVGRLEKQKNFESLVLSMKGINANLIIIGSGSLRSKLTKLARQNKINLKLIPKINHPQMPAIYNSADIFVLPSIVEGSPKVLLEAMACGVPVIGTKVEGIKNIILHCKNGLLVEPDNRNIRLGVMNLIDDGNLREKLAANARAFIKKTYDLKYLIKLEIDAIKSIKK